MTECGYHCAGRSVPAHVCDPALAPRPGHAEPVAPTPEEAMGHGGHGDMSMAEMVADMRNRFLVAAIFAVPILLWSPIGRDVLGFSAGVPFGLREDVWR